MRRARAKVNAPHQNMRLAGLDDFLCHVLQALAERQ